MVLLAATPAWAGSVRTSSGPFVFIEFDTQLTSLNLTGGPFLMPLASDPTNALGDSIEGFGLVNSSVGIMLSSMRSPTPGPATRGHATASNGGEGVLGVGSPGSDPINPDQLDGQIFQVNSFFDVFFDITVTDMDSRLGRDFAGMPDGASIMLFDNGPANMQSSYSAIFDKDAPNFGLIPPPEADPYRVRFTQSHEKQRKTTLNRT
ncbi:MAG: hypothetical protein EXS05_02015 [Planctomycetaceae bacterium]|nr:hypothetical protein [Planctomycetaceae bacterium]